MEKEALLVEAALFSAGKALAVREMAEATGLDDSEVRKALKKIIRIYGARETALAVMKVGPKYQMQLKEEFVEPTRDVAPKDMPKDIVKTLSLIAYYQPISQSRLADMVGGKVYAHVKELVQTGLVTSKTRGRTKSLSTTQLFLEKFGINAKNTEEVRKAMEEKMGL
ncbi:MAG: SMC-Scp complex subunit ScpB [Candidatus Thermoplasmatota archaeon]|nr:SMC-Scp complex subunit ScpB [Candidatus Thermoplasmatota archaeon]